MKKTFLIGAALAVTLTAGAQFRIDKDYPEAGTKVVVDSVAGQKSIVVDFNTNKSGLSVQGGSLVRAQNQRGMKVEVYTETGAVVQPPNNDSRINNYGGNGNMLCVEDVANIISYYTDPAAGAWSANHKFWMPSNALFYKNAGDASDRVFGVYPGMYKEILSYFYFNLDGLYLSSDLSVEMYTYDAGNTGAKAAYTMLVGIGKDYTGDYLSNPDYTNSNFYKVDSIYVTGDALKTINVAEAIGLETSALNGKKLYITFRTKGTGVAMNPFQYDPVVVYDNFKVSATMPFWLTPDVGVEGNAVVNNSATPVENISLDENNRAIFPIDLEMKNRISAMKTTIDVENSNPAVLKYRLSGAQTWDGTQWVDIAGVQITAPVYDADKDSWSKESMTIPVTSATGDQEKVRILVYRDLKDTDNNGDIVTTRFELDNGVRIYYDYSGKINKSATSAAAALAEDMNIYASSGKLYVTNYSDDISIFNLSGQLVKTITGIDGQKGISLAEGNYLVSTKDGTVKVNIQK